MIVTSKQPHTEPVFHPIEITITIQSKAELVAWYKLSNWGGRVAQTLAEVEDLIYNVNEYKASQAGRCYEALFDHLTPYLQKHRP